MFFDRIKKESGDLIILTNDTENIIMSLFAILTGLFGLWFFPTFCPIFNIHSVYSIVMGVVIMSLPVLFILQGFQNLIVRSKATIDLDLHEIIMERKWLSGIFP